ncbi:MAG: hypothetical protein AAGA96_20085 [Verrucomicrobiota bacterium]
MSEEKIQYRGAEMEQSEETKGLAEGKHTEHVQYRGAEGDVEIGHETRKENVQYRGAEGEVDV